MPSFDRAVTIDEEADNSLSFVRLSLSNASSTLPPQLNKGPSGLDLVTASSWAISPAYGFHSTQQHANDSQHSFSLVSEPAFTAGHIDGRASSVNPRDFVVDSEHSWMEAHMIAEPGRDVDWQTYLSPEWPPSAPSSTGSMPSQYGAILCGECANATYQTREDWFAHLQQEHPEWICWLPETNLSSWHGIACCYTCIGPHAMQYTEESWWVHVWMGHPEWPIWVPFTCILGCADTAFHNKGAWLAHLWKLHSNRGVWVSRHCMWENCAPTRRPYKTFNEWLNHVKKKHQKSFMCGILSCSRYGDPFGSQADLNRHHRQVHQPAVHCTKTNCQAKRRGNTRRDDKHEEHDRRWHGDLPCFEPICPRRTAWDGTLNGFSTDDDLQRHLRDAHYLHRRGM